MTENIQFTSEGKILFNSGLIVFNCNCCPEGCEFCSSEATTIDVSFSGVADNMAVDCADCTAYNSTTYTCTQVGTGCAWSGVGECGHTIDVVMTSGSVDVYVNLGFTVLAQFNASVSDPFDCTANRSLTLFSGAADECDWSGAACTIN